MATGVDAYGHSVVKRPPKPLRHDDSQDLEKNLEKIARNGVCRALG